MPVGGDILEITYNHPTHGSGTLLPKANEDSSFDPGGFRSDDDANQVDGGGNMIDKMNRVRWGFECPIAWDMNGNNELETMRLLASDPVQADWTVTSVNLTVWAGKGKPVGDLVGNGNTSLLPLKVAGGGQMKKIVG